MSDDKNKVEIKPEVKEIKGGKMAKKDTPEEAVKNDGKSEALKLALAQITKQFGDGAIMKLGEAPKMARVVR